jgi:glycoprotein 3-alpha-L-fucosyltransferase/alpha-1,3-fucosyltransferase
MFITQIFLPKILYSCRPKSRPSQQRWLFTFYESPSFTRHLLSYNSEIYDDIFNLTATYHINSDFPGLYYVHSQIIWELNENFDEKYDYTIDKIDLAAAVISNSRNHVTSNRLLYINELKKYMKVDIYGGQGKPCPTVFRDKNKNISNFNVSNYYFERVEGKCKEIIYHEYKFYFAFENSICDDYITEKFFLTLRKPIIPVVLGAGPYDYYVRLILF